MPIDSRAGAISIRVETVPEHGMATIWDADVLIWAASQIVDARDAGLKTSRLMAATPYEILTFVGRGMSARDYDRLKAGLDRLQSTTVMTSIRQPTERRRHRFSWINEWKETADANGRPLGLELILPDWFYAGVIDDAPVLTIDRAYFDLTGIHPQPSGLRAASARIEHRDWSIVGKQVVRREDVLAQPVVQPHCSCSASDFADKSQTIERVSPRVATFRNQQFGVLKTNQSRSLWQ
ncbi:plasmid replication initiation protein [Bradyrhizobium sp. GM24.11]